MKNNYKNSETNYIYKLKIVLPISKIPDKIK